MAEQLRGVLANPRTTAPEAAAPMRLLLQLQADGAATVQPLNPVKLYLDTQVRLQAAEQAGLFWSVLIALAHTSITAVNQLC